MKSELAAALPDVDGLSKGMPPGAARTRFDDLAGLGWNVLREDLPLPVAVLKESALARNEAWMQAFLRHTGALMAPHGKTTMSPQLFERQLEGGAWAITVATVHQLRVCREFGCRRVVMANQLVGRQAIRYALDELASDPGFEFYCLVDSTDGVGLLDRELRDADPGRPLNVFVEGGYAGGRTGCRDLEAALAVARAVKACAPCLALRGVEGFEGLNDKAPDEEIVRFLRFLVAIAEAVDAEGLFSGEPVFLSAGGSAFFDLVVKTFRQARLRAPVRILTRSGCYITHDSAMYERAFARLRERSPELAGEGPGPAHALEVWAYVQSRPEPEKAILTIGKRDVSHDVEWPRPLLWYRPGGHDAPVDLPAGHEVTGLNDQHAHLRVPSDSPLAVGDMVAFGVAHPCTTFDKWQVMFVVDDDYTVKGAIRTFF